MKFFAPCFLLLLVAPLTAAPPITALAYTPDSEQLIVGSQAGIEVFVQHDLVLDRKFSVELENIHDIAFSPNGQLLAIAGGQPGEFGEIVVCRWPSGQIVWRRAAHGDLIYRVVWDDAGTRMATVGADHLAQTLDVTTGQTLQIFRGHSRPVVDVSLFNGGAQLVTAGIDRTIRIWDVATGETVRALDNHTDAVRAVAIRPQGAAGLPVLASVGGDHTLRFWQPTIGRLMRFVRLPAEPLAIAWELTGQHVLVGCTDGHVRRIAFESLAVVADRQVMPGWVYEIAVAPDGGWIAVAGTDHQLAQFAVGDLDDNEAAAANTLVHP